jgi:hypothetical protein
VVISRVVVVAANATTLEQRAANELAHFIGQLLLGDGAPPLPVMTPAAAKGKPQFAVGPTARCLFQGQEFCTRGLPRMIGIDLHIPPHPN